MEHETPWVSCFLTRMVILHLEETGEDSAIDYQAILHGSNPSNRIDDPKGFLKDYNNWVPHHILVNLIQAAEEAAGSKEVTYLAGRNYFRPRQAPSILELIMKLLNNVEQILLYSNLWAGGYTNYLKLQSVKARDTEPSELIILSRFGLNVEPLIGSINLIRGNYEGFTRLFDYVDETACIEEVSQLKLETIVREFDGYRIEKSGERISIVESATGNVAVTAQRAFLQGEQIPIPHDTLVDNKELVVAPSDGKASIITPLKKMTQETNEAYQKEENGVYEIVSGGTLKNGPLTYAFHHGKFYNAPYSRYRYWWTQRKVPRELPFIAKAKADIVPLLFYYIRGLRETQTRVLRSTIENEELARTNENLRSTIRQESDFLGMIGKGPGMQRLFEQVKLVAKAESTVLIVGETGTGKELLARAIHRLSPRQSERFFAINCAVLTESLLEAELFGYEKGAITGAQSMKKGIFETAHGGTLLLDEVGEISPAMQVKLLRVLEEEEIRRVGGRETIPIDVRIISATNRDLKELVDTGRFRNDLYYRLHVISLQIPPLRERREDTLLLVDHFLGLFSKKCKKEKPTLTREAVVLLENHTWPGNIRELKNVIECAVVLDSDNQITRDDIIIHEIGTSVPPEEGGRIIPYHETVEGHKRHVIEEALIRTNGNRTQAAELLGLQRTYLSRLIRQLGI
ncbi:MAG: AAA domain-containing protein [Deltaproteobacteria bacterium]|nr:AAA domain-containing protein [Deltaproteobacteria bacterium]